MGLRELALGQGGGFRAPLFLTFGVSRTWVVPFDMEAIVHAIGGCGSGGATNGAGNATGAGAPGYTAKRVKLTAGTVLTFSIGAVGAAATATNNNSVNGGSGGATTVTGGGLDLVANGGGGGKASGLATSILGGLGGTASGGDVNHTGGRGGNITGASGSNATRATGAGAVNLFGFGTCDGGDLLNNSVTGSGTVQATGGGSCTGSGSSANTQSSVLTTAGDVSALMGLLAGASPSPLCRPILGMQTVGPVSAVSGTDSGFFTGGQGWYATSGQVAGAIGSKAFGGAGGAAGWGGAANSFANYCSAGGAAGTSANCTSSTGRPGLIVVEILS